MIQVSWSGVQRPTNADAVALYFAGDSPDERSPLKFKWAFASSKSYLQTGAGSHTCARPCLCQHQYHCDMCL